MSEGVGFEHRSVWPDRPEEFRAASSRALQDSQTRANLLRATAHIQARRSSVIQEMPDWEALRQAGAATKQRVLRHLDKYLVEVEQAVVAAGGVVHFARDASEANKIVVDLVKAQSVTEVVKVKSLTTDELGLNQALASAGIAALETDLAELICQLGGEHQSHVLVPAVHLSRKQIRDIFIESMPGVAPDLLADPVELAGAARRFLRERFLAAKVAVSGANFVVAETGSVVIVESEGNGRMCLTLPEVLISVVGIEKILPSFADLEVFLALLPRSATGERANPYTSVFSGVTPGDGPQEFHLVLVDNNRSQVLADPLTRQSLQCIRCSACMNVCPVYTRVGGHAYGSVYPGPIGAILTPKLKGLQVAGSLPFASTLCGACAEVCPVRIDIPRVLVHLRAETKSAEARARRLPSAESVTMHALGAVMADPVSFAAGERLISSLARPLRARGRSTVSHLPGPLRAWSDARDAPIPPAESFRSWWERKRAVPATAMASLGCGESPATPMRTPQLVVLKSYLRAGVLAVRSLRLERLKAATSTAPYLARRDSTPREAVLKSVRDALVDVPAAELPGDVVVAREYRRTSSGDVAALAALFAERVMDYEATVVRVAESEVVVALNCILKDLGASFVSVPVDLPEQWLPTGVELLRDGRPRVLTTKELDSLDATITGCAGGIAETGTIVLDGVGRSGRRAVSLVPDRHICIVEESQLVGTFAEALDHVEATRALTFVSGPSATSDIELTRVEGVHGPRTLVVLLVSSS